MPLLELENVDVMYNRSVRGIERVCLELDEATIVGVIGRNGAGKTTTLNAIAGFLPSSNGRIVGGAITYQGRRISGVRPDAIARRGISLIPERKKIFSRLSVNENLDVSSGEGGSARFSLRDVYSLFPILKERGSLIAGYLSGGERQMLALAMGLLGSPNVVLLDEMSLGLAPRIAATIAETIRSLRDEYGVSFLVVEENAAIAVDFVDYMYVIENGQVAEQGTPAELSTHPQFREYHLGMGTDGTRSYRNALVPARNEWWLA